MRKRILKRMHELGLEAPTPNEVRWLAGIFRPWQMTDADLDANLYAFDYARCVCKT